MTHKCKKCGKILGSTCDYCGNANLKDSVNHPGTLDCNNCHRAAMPRGRPTLTVCHECEQKGVS